MREAAVTFFYLGHLPKIPGTWGSAGAAACYIAFRWVAQERLGLAGVTIDLVVIVATVLAAALGVALGPWAVRRFENKDPGPFVLDEVAGQWLSLLAVPIVTPPRLLVVVAVQFVLFRLFDIVKPPPARQLEGLPHGWGIVADDLAAAVYVNLLGQVMFRYLWPVASGA